MGQVVRADAVSDTPIGGITLYLYALVPAGAKGGQWVGYGSGSSVSDPQGFWAKGARAAP